MPLIRKVSVVPFGNVISISEPTLELVVLGLRVVDECSVVAQRAR